MSTSDAPLVLIKGDATDEEVAALVAVVQAVASAAASATPSAPAPRSAWADPARSTRRPMHASPQGWRTSGLPW